MCSQSLIIYAVHTISAQDFIISPLRCPFKGGGEFAPTPQPSRDEGGHPAFFFRKKMMMPLMESVEIQYRQWNDAKFDINDFKQNPDVEEIPKLCWNIYWINLERRPDRCKHMQKILANNQNNSFRVQAVDYKNNFYPYTVIKHPKLNGGELGCTCSHIKALKTYLEATTDSYCFVAEDDLSNMYSTYWTKEHVSILNHTPYDVLQLQTTSGAYKNEENTLTPENKYSTGTTIYRISRSLAQSIVEKHFDASSNTFNLSNHDHPVTDNFIYSYGTPYLLPMFTYVNVKDSDTNYEANNQMNEYWMNFFDQAKKKYLNMWKNHSNI